MTLAGLSARVNRVIAWAGGLQRRHGVLGFPYAVAKKYGDDGAAGSRAHHLLRVPEHIPADSQDHPATPAPSLSPTASSPSPAASWSASSLLWLWILLGAIVIVGVAV